MEESSESILAAASRLRGSLARLSRRLRRERSEHGPSLSKLSVLGCLQRNGPMSAGALASQERLQPQSLTRVLSDLQKRGLIVRRQDPEDHRRSIVEITKTGTDTLREDMGRRDAWLAGAMIATLSPTERELLLLAARLMDRLTNTH